MPLSPPAPRKHLHTRKVECFGYQREDGLWDIEGHITDTKTYSFVNTERGELEPGMPVHDMWIRLTINDRMEIVDAEAVTEASPFSICGNIAPDYKKLIGLRIVSGFTQAVKDRLGGTAGCTHLTELLGPVGTVAYQTMVRPRQPPPLGAGLEPVKRPRVLNTCHAFHEEGPIVKRLWPDYYTGPDA